VEERLDLLFGSETRERPLRITGGGGLTLLDGDTVLFKVGARPFLAALLSVASEAGGPFGDWAKKVRSSIPGSG